MKIKYRIIVGVIFMITGFYGFILGCNSDSFLYKDRVAVIIDMMSGSHQYKGQTTSDYYLSIKYLDEPLVLYGVKTTGEIYINAKKGNHITYRVERDKIINQILMIYVSISMIFTCFLLGSSLADYQD